jgi:LCP family protein required for cell wall assembly
LLSIPRDLWVDIPGHGVYSGWNRINAAFNTGPSVLVQTIEDNLKIPIDHYAAVNFAGFANMVNALGGIYLDFRDPVYDQYSGLNIETRGCQLINGSQALALVRSRHLYYYAGTGPAPAYPEYNWSYDGLSDFSRIRRQDAFFRAVINRAKSEVGITNVLSLLNFLRAVASNLTVDTAFRGNLRSLAFEFRNANTKDLHTEVLPTYGLTVNGNEVLGEAQPYGSQMITRLLESGSTAPRHHGTATSQPGHGGAPAATTTTSTPSGSVVFDTPTADPEPWNPVPCHS